MKLKKWLSYMDTTGLTCNIWIKYKLSDGTYGEDCVYAGSMYEIPYWLVNYKLFTDEDEEAIYWAHYIRTTPDDENGTEGCNGFVITVIEGEKNE